MIFFLNCHPTLKSIRNKSSGWVEEIIRFGKITLLSLFLFNFFFSFREKSNWEWGECGGEGAEFPVPRQGALSGLWSFSCPLWCGIGGCGEDPGAVCTQKPLGAAALSCSPFVLLCNFNLFFVGGVFFGGLPHPNPLIFFMGWGCVRSRPDRASLRR